MRKYTLFLFLLIVAFIFSLVPQVALAQSTAPKNGGLTFSEKEVAYMKSQRVARIATVSKKSQPDVAPVAFEFDGEFFYVGGVNNLATMKYRNVKNGNTKIALVFDDWESLEPWRPRSLKIHGTADVITRKGRFGEAPYLRITPQVKWSMGVDEPAFQNGKAVIKRMAK